MNKDEKKIKSVFNEHIDRIGKWPPSWSDIESAVREAYWAGASASDEEDSGDLVEDLFEDGDIFLDNE